ncbi:MAG: methyltransferase domain-containing protein [Planctomycetaceae bacterium]|nr:methyltransferase domain-containing protein [Planctomycetaceae bacterium]
MTELSVDVSPLAATIAAIDAVAADVRATSNKLDTAYFLHRPRYERNISRIQELCPLRGRILDVGSHYLHTSCALALMGYSVTGIDVSAFSQSEVVRRRAKTFGVENITIDNLALGDFLADRTDAYDLVLFSEILEHITFNPVLFWNRIYHLLRPGGCIFITTPNALTPWKIMSTLKRVLFLQGVGVTVPGIFNTVTYGHHWKEYSINEVRQYFPLLTKDFEVDVSTYHYRSDVTGPASLKTMTRRVAGSIGKMLPWFRDELDIVVRLKARTGWLQESPRFI